MKSTPSYLQGNPHVEATNRTSQKVLSQKIYIEPKVWSDVLSFFPVKVLDGKMEPNLGHTFL